MSDKSSENKGRGSKSGSRGESSNVTGGKRTSKFIESTNPSNKGSNNSSTTTGSTGPKSPKNKK